MSTVFLTRGLSGSGKSYWARETSVETGAFQLEMDQYRAMFGFPSGSPQWIRAKEALAFQCMLDNLVSLVKKGQDVILSNTHVSNNWPEQYRQALQGLGVVFKAVDFMEAPIETCIERDLARNGYACVGENVIRRQYKTFLRNPYPNSGVWEEWLNSPLPFAFEPKQYVWYNSKRRAVVFDLDGTLFHMSPDRGPYQYHLVEKDAPNWPVINALKAHQAAGWAIVLSSGRDGGFRRYTERALEAAGITYDDLFMRPAGSKAKDSFVKHHMVHNEIGPKYDISLWYDDRQQVVDMLRSIGITVAQVAPGQF